ncbi:MAG: (2Fe-2S)-binding protein [Polyangiaceae bacterium]|nr:(2Fe-2S)-binding protein [Polyangiaceae bacterium]
MPCADDLAATPAAAGAQLTLAPKGTVADVRRGETLLDGCNRVHAPLAQSCSGHGVCGHCRVRVVAGGESLPPPSAREQSLRERRDFGRDERVACLAVPAGDVVITTTYW